MRPGRSHSPSRTAEIRLSVAPEVIGAVRICFDKVSAALAGIAAGLDAGPATFDALDAGSAALDAVGAGFYVSEKAFDARSAAFYAVRMAFDAEHVTFSARQHSFDAGARRSINTMRSAFQTWASGIRDLERCLPKV